MQTSANNTVSQSGIQHLLDIRRDDPDEWAAGLPLANLGETCRLIFSSLTQMRGVDVPATQRIKALESLRSPVRYLRDALRRRYTGTAFPLPEKNRKIAQLLREIQLEMAGAYHQAVSTLLGQNGLRQDVDGLVTALHRALYYHGQSLLTSYELYEEVDGARWRTIYTLYLEAERKAMHLGVVKDPLKQGDGNTSVSDVFKQILLLALADPHHLTQHEMNTTYTLLESWAGQCQLYTLTDFNEPPGVFVMDLDGDAPPAYLIYNTVRQQSTTRMLDTTALSHSLRGLLTQAGQDHMLAPARANTQKETYSRDLLRRLLLSWGHSSKRVFSRAGQTDSVVVIFGLSASHQAVNEHRAGAPYAMSGATCRIINESATGARLRWEGGEAARVRVGELIAVRHGDDGGSENLGIGVIRWLKSQAGRSVDFGMQMLVPSATPIKVRLADSGETERDYLKAFLMPIVPPQDSVETLMTPAFLYHPGDIISVKTGETERRLRLGRAVEGTQAYTRFEFTTLAEALEETEDDVARIRKKEFDSVWSGL